MRTTGYFLVWCVLTILNFSCINASQKGQVKSESEIAGDSVTKTDHSVSSINNSLTDAALFIAGLPVDSSSKFFQLTQTPEWKKYQKDADSAWSRFNKTTQKITNWKNREIPQTNDKINTLFYAFGGPDYLFANIFFPNAKNYILIGLENPGNPPQASNFKKDSLKNILSLYRTAINDVIQLSFFRTVDMNVELKETIDGTTPIIMLFLVRSGKQIVSISPSNLSADGKFVPKTNRKASHMATDIAFVTPGDSTIHHVYYLSTNLADPSLSKDKGFMAFLNSIDSTSYSFVKSATYLMHKNYFSIIRNTVLNKSDLVLQDASGIAYKFYNKAKWDIKLFGVYEKPIPLFKDFYEADLDEAYKKGATPITFRYGYNRNSSMLMAIKK